MAKKNYSTPSQAFPNRMAEIFKHHSEPRSIRIFPFTVHEFPPHPLLVEVLSEKLNLITEGQSLQLPLANTQRSTLIQEVMHTSRQTSLQACEVKKHGPQPASSTTAQYVKLADEVVFPKAVFNWDIFTHEVSEEELDDIKDS